MGYRGYNPCKSSYFTLLKRVFFGPPSTRLTNLLGPLLTQGGHKSKFIWTVPGCLLLQSIYRNTLPENWTNVHPKQGPIWAVLKTSWESILITWSFAKTFRHSFANLVFSFAGMNFTKTSFASFRGGRCHLKKKSLHDLKKKEFAYRMRARRPTSAMPKPFLCCERAFCCSMVVMWPVLMSWSCLRREMK